MASANPKQYITYALLKLLSHDKMTPTGCKAVNIVSTRARTN